MESFYEINVSYKGSHLFANDPRSCRSSSAYKNLLNILLVKFPAEEGYAISGSYWEGKGVELFNREAK